MFWKEQSNQDEHVGSMTCIFSAFIWNWPMISCWGLYHQLEWQFWEGGFMANGLTIPVEIQIFKDVFLPFSFFRPVPLTFLRLFPRPPHLRHEWLKSMVKLKEWPVLWRLTEGVKGGRPPLNSTPCVTNACNYICACKTRGDSATEFTS